MKCPDTETESQLGVGGGKEEWRVTPNGYKVSFWGDENILE